MDATLERLVQFRELGKVAPPVIETVLDVLRQMSAATIDRHSTLASLMRRPAPGWSANMRS